MNGLHAVRDGWHDASFARRCLVCTNAVPSRRARSYSRACPQPAYRLQQAPTTTLAEPMLRQALQRRRTLAAQTVFECPACQARFLGQRRCDDCHHFCRALGLGGGCPDGDTLIVLSGLLELEVPI